MKTSMTSPVGMYSHKSNPLKQAKKVEPKCSGSNKDAVKANSLLQQAQSKVDSLRGKSGM
jgi:hypothetical protein